MDPIRNELEKCAAIFKSALHPLGAANVPHGASNSAAAYVGGSHITGLAGFNTGRRPGESAYDFILRKKEQFGIAAERR